MAQTIQLPKEVKEFLWKYGTYVIDYREKRSAISYQFLPFWIECVEASLTATLHPLENLPPELIELIKEKREAKSNIPEDLKQKTFTQDQSFKNE